MSAAKLLDAIAPELHEYAAAANVWLCYEEDLLRECAVPVEPYTPADDERRELAHDSLVAFDRALRAEARVRALVDAWKGGAQ